MTKFINKFLKEEDGAVTVDWVVLTAAIVGLGIAVLASVETGLTGTVAVIETQIADEATQTYSF